MDDNGIKTPGLITNISALSGLINDYETANDTDKEDQLPTIKKKITSLKSKYEE
jgi:hypothetical protein